MKGLRVLDLGSGLSRHAARLAALGAEVTAVDVSSTQHERAVTRYPSSSGLRFVCAARAPAHRRHRTPLSGSA
ncbi:class I SAM-dependent methyltransferase [Streptomyces erythrochromogenes]|uniref:class I SAM-dependent methyltransferase n=1 Tax=Streptomyces erythrochromogenes TaxID=285574 RepID=UPI003642B701